MEHKCTELYTQTIQHWGFKEYLYSVYHSVITMLQPTLIIHLIQAYIRILKYIVNLILYTCVTLMHMCIEYGQIHIYVSVYMCIVCVYMCIHTRT